MPGRAALPSPSPFSPVPRARVLVVDDEAFNRSVLRDALSPHYAVLEAADGVAALAVLRQFDGVALIIADILMPELDGFELCRCLKHNPATAWIPVLFLSSLDNPADEARGLALGAEDFIHKPFSLPVIQARVRNHLELAQARRQLHLRNVQLEHQVAERTRELLLQKQQLIAAQDATIAAFCALAEARDNETGNHIRRTQHYVAALAEAVRHHPQFAAEIDDATIALLFKSAPLHDVGKVAVPDAILLKPGPLSPDEWAVMRCHCEWGHDAIAEAESTLVENAGYLRLAREIAWCHHEKWDGSGYPRGLAGPAIPLSARLMAVADVYDALISRRCYKPALPHAVAVAHVQGGAGSHFDPELVAAFLDIADQFDAIARRFADPQPHPALSSPGAP